MPITLGDTTISGLAAGGLPNAVITNANLASGVGGKVLQVGHNQGFNSFVTYSTSFQEVSNFNINITPISSTSKIIVEFTASAFAEQGRSGIYVRLYNHTNSVYVSTENRLVYRYDAQANINQFIFSRTSGSSFWYIDSWGTSTRSYRIYAATSSSQAAGFNAGDERGTLRFIEYKV
jgi:hypothetical protein